MAIINLNDTTPAAPTGKVNVKWQADANTPRNVSAYVDLPVNPTAVSETPTAVNSNWSVVRVALSAGQNGAHVLNGTMPFGVQVIGYGSYTSYQYPAGLDLAEIAPPPPPPTIK